MSITLDYPIDRRSTVAPRPAWESLWDYRRQVADLYGQVRALGGGEPAWQFWRAERDRLFWYHAQSPLSAAQKQGRGGLDLFPYTPSLRFAVALEPLHGEPFEIDAGQDGVLTLQPFARTGGLAEAFGRELTLYWIKTYGGGVFLPFRDASDSTYGGGRYLLDTIKSADLGNDRAGRTILDFNFAYNPSCAYSDKWVCPLAPRENRLEVAVEAGERIFAPGH